MMHRPIKINLVPPMSKFPGLNRTKRGVRPLEVKDKILLSNRTSLSFNLEFKRKLEVKFDFKSALSNSCLCCHFF